MLKGRGKTFAPKKVPARKPGSTPAPPSALARPSVERQSQTPAPAPSQTPQELPPVAGNSTATAATVVERIQASRIHDGAQGSSTLDAPTSLSSASTTYLKRKEREHNDVEPLWKRQALEGGDTEDSAASDNIAPVVEMTSATAPESPPSPADTVQSLKRKDRAPLPSAPPAKRMSPVPTRDPDSIRPTALSSVLPPSQTSHSLITTGASSAGRYELTGSSSSATKSDSDRRSGASVILNRQNSGSPPADSSERQSNAQNRYPSPENMVRIADDIQTGSLSADGIAERVNAAGSGISGPSDVVAMASLNPDGTSGGIIEEPIPGTDKGKSKQKGNATSSRRRVQTANDADDARATVNMSLHGGRRATGAKRIRKRRDPAEIERRRRVRAATPEGASDEEIDVTVMTMGDLTKDLKIGKRFSRYNEIKEMEELKKREAMKAKMRRQHPELAALIDANGQAAAVEPSANPLAGQQGEPNASHEGGAPEVNEREPSPEPPQGMVSGPRMRLLNGRMVLDETSLTIDRHANAQMEREGMEIVEENDFSRVVTQGTYMKREPSQSWDPAANQLFYKGLRQFGTDFQMIAAMFPHRNRRQIKLKFNKEEKVNAAKINRILMNPKEPIDLDQFEKMSDMKLQPLEAIEAEREKFDAEQREEIAKFTEAAAEATRKKKESIKGSEAARRILANMSDDSDGGEEGIGGSNKENTGGKGKRKKAVSKKRRGGKNDDPGEIVGTIE